MYLSRFRVNTGRPAARRLLSSPQALHAAVMSSFPSLLPSDLPAPESPRVLWRLEQKARAEVLLYVVSPDRPDMTHLVEQAGWPAVADPENPGWHTRSYKPFLDRLTTGQHWGFRLTANPVHTIRRTDDEPKKITAHLTPTHQRGWLLDPDRQARCGFRILQKPDSERLLPDSTAPGGAAQGDRHELAVSDMRPLSFDKSRGHDGKRRGKPVTVVTVTFDGRLEVTDPTALRRALTQGIGRARAYGCGLLTLAPINQPPRPTP
ncbi:type I-E CRISPR-associated protein Cas6/Cse3/CasE [Streptomyces sp. V3I7]|uniref:type I-E CRISPR-associated protein Cas6/Cse3/CasE n=1 Tax=Streptomyces sp. V3I7 TaxID=3042278 RepID=UPI0027815B79|nr:type I-E CRISPR-associated protein Cas6/Cse3/CasE [Streptomyces sp. V3I7]MDQ0994744.1 CRISPR system Cascade subunit CasE [Streptomyces sp. V3I7]